MGLAPSLQPIPFGVGSLRSVADFPDNLLFHVLSFLLVDQVENVRTVDKRTRGRLVRLPVLHLVGPRVVRFLGEISSIYQSVRSLHVRAPGDKLTQSITRDLVTKFPHLTSFVLDGTCIRNDQIELILQGNQRLHNLQLSGVSFVPSETIIKFSAKYRSLTSLNFSGCRTLTDAAIAAICESAIFLNTIVLNGCTQLKCPIFKSSHVKRIEMQECASLVSPSFLHTPLLVDLDLSNCRALPDASAAAVPLQCPSIRWISLSGCSGLRKLEMEVDDGLRSLDLALCTGLDSLHLHSSSIVRLDVGMCIKLRLVNVKLPRVTHLNLGMLEALNDITVNCAKLQQLSLYGCRHVDAMNLLCPSTVVVHLSGSGLSTSIFDESSLTVSDDHVPAALGVVA